MKIALVLRLKQPLNTILQLPVRPASSHDEWPFLCFLYLCLTLFNPLKQHFPAVRRITGLIAFPFTHLSSKTASILLISAWALQGLEAPWSSGAMVVTAPQVFMAGSSSQGPSHCPSQGARQDWGYWGQS